jgi:hypothetical protein
MHTQSPMMRCGIQRTQATAVPRARAVGGLAQSLLPSSISAQSILASTALSTSRSVASAISKISTFQTAQARSPFLLIGAMSLPLLTHIFFQFL